MLQKVTPKIIKQLKEEFGLGPEVALALIGRIEEAIKYMEQKKCVKK